MRQVVLLKSGSKRGGGLEKYAERIASAFSSRGDQVTYLCTGKPPNAIPGIKFHSFSTQSLFSFSKIEKFDLAVTHWLKNHHADIIFGLDRNREQTHLRAGNGVHAAFLKSRISTEGKMKYYLSLMNPLHRKILSIEKYAYSNTRLKKIFTNSHMVAKELQEHYSTDPSKIEVIHNGAEWKEMEPVFSGWEQGRKKAFKNYHLDPHLFHILFIGHGYLRKGLGALIKALACWKFRDFHLSIIGSDKNIDLYVDKVKKLKMSHQIRFFGPQKNTSLFYQLADILVIPSFYDPFANVTVEALSMGLFVISSKQNGGHEVLTKQNGKIIDDLFDTESIIEALNESLTHRKSKQSSIRIRQSVSHLDFSYQLTKLIKACG
jgi:UDP-glucose:(heptosyl)LPS alpha-1,3-glucosyltransferase